LSDVPPSIYHVALGWVMVLTRSGVGEPGARQWLVEQRRIGPSDP
jgi:hypothetical protein